MKLGLVNLIQKDVIYLINNHSRDRKPNMLFHLVVLRLVFLNPVCPKKGSQKLPDTCYKILNDLLFDLIRFFK